MIQYLIGPEAFWLLLYLAVSVLAKANKKPSAPFDKKLEQCWFWIPLIAILVFGLWAIPFVAKKWLLLRVWISGLVGGHLSIDRALSAYSQQGPGIGMGYLAGLMLHLLFLVLGSILIIIFYYYGIV